MRYLLNSAVITSPGSYTYSLISPEEAREWYHADAPPVSTIGYAETALVLSQLLGVVVELNRVSISMQAGDEALVFRIVLPPGSQRIDPRDKGCAAQVLKRGHYELGLLRRIS